MRRFWVLTLGLLWAAGVQAQGNAEFRAMWVVDTQWLEDDNSAEENKRLTREILDNLKRANFTSVLWQVRRFGTAYYPSTFEPWGPQVNFADPGYDPLAYAIEQAHARGLELHAWFNVFEARHRYAGSPSAENPEWICRDRDGLVMPDDIAWLSPGLEAVRSYLVDAAMEIVNNYDIDGLHLDFVRWNEHTNSETSQALAKQARQQPRPDGVITPEQLQELLTNFAGRYLYDVEHPFSAGVPDGFDTWEDWWRWSVTEFVRTLRDSVGAVKPWVRVSPAALGRYNWGGWQGFGVVYQDAALWLNEGYIDQLTGMHYHWNLPDDFYSVLVGDCPNCWSQYIGPAIQAGQLYTVGLFSDQFARDKVFSRHDPIIDRVRDVPWVDGFQFFSYASWRDQNYWEVPPKQFFQKKAKIRATGLIDDTPPEAPTLELTKLDSLNYEVAVSPANATDEAGWFAIYRSTDAALDVDRDEIIDVHFGAEPYSYVDAFTGTQDFDGQYTYFATALDRFWNESAMSNSEVSEAIPSFAPEVVSTTPASGDSIPVGAEVEIAFSKTMVPATFDGAVAFTPAVEIAALHWSSDQKTVTIETATPFDFATEYTLTIDASVTDVNGKALDGNGDGVPGDPFELAFKTLARDLIGPQVLASYPSLESDPGDFKIDEIITFVFDELIDHSSVIDSAIVLTQDESKLSVGYHVATVGEQSVLSIQPLETLEPDQAYTVTLLPFISDTAGNAMASEMAVPFRTSPERYAEVVTIEQFLSTTNWFQPNQSGSTEGIVVPNTSFEMSTDAYLPALHVRQRISPSLKYEWDESAANHLIRVYLADGDPREVLFDTSYVLQCYVFSDGSNNEFRFAVDDNVPVSAAENHEVSQWVTLNWLGWRIIEWPLNDPNSVGIWIGDGALEGTLRFDSFQLTHQGGDAASGQIFFDNLRLVKKTTTPVHVAATDPGVPDRFQLLQNYPNPFNPSTTIVFHLPEAGEVELTVYDILGRTVEKLVQGRLPAGRHTVRFDGGELASGVYIYRLTMGERTRSRRMLLVK